MIGAAVGETLAHLVHLPGETQALWALLGMGAMLSGALGVPLTAILFSLELTHALPALLPLTLACIASYLVTSLVMPRSILTEKLSRRGYHLSREYGVDPLEMVSVADVMTEVAVSADSDRTTGVQGELPKSLAYSDETCREVAEEMATTGVMNMPVVDRETGQICGHISAQELLTGRRRAVERESKRNSSFRLESKQPS
jgi:hypothetical protein